MTQQDARSVLAGCHRSSSYQSTHGNNFSHTDQELLIRLFHIGAATHTRARAHTRARPRTLHDETVYNY